MAVGNGNIFVANSASNTISVIDVKNGVTSNISGLTSPTWIAFDSANGNIYVVQSTLNNVAVISEILSTTTNLESSNNPSVIGHSVTFTATVSPYTASGQVTFSDITTTPPTILGTSLLSGGTATFSTSSLSVGTHTSVASYSGDSIFTGSTSGTITVTVSNTSADPCHNQSGDNQSGDDEPCHHHSRHHHSGDNQSGNSQSGNNLTNP